MMGELFQQQFGKLPEDDLLMVREILQTRQYWQGWINSNMDLERLYTMRAIESELRQEGWNIINNKAVKV